MSSPGQDTRPWLVFYDRDCGFCRWSLGVILRADRERRLRPVALQSPEATTLLSDLTPEQRMASWHLLSPTGERHSAGAAVPTLASLLPGGRVSSAVLGRMPTLDDRGYRWVAEHRSWFGRPISDAAKRRADAIIRERSKPPSMT